MNLLYVWALPVLSSIAAIMGALLALASSRARRGSTESPHRRVLSLLTPLALFECFWNVYMIVPSSAFEGAAYQGSMSALRSIGWLIVGFAFVTIAKKAQDRGFEYLPGG